MNSKNQIDWSRMTLEELKNFYNTEIAPVMRRDGLDPWKEKPSYSWLAKNGFSGITYSLRKKHDLTLSEFFHDIVGIPRKSNGYNWGIEDEDTIYHLESYLKSRKGRRNLSESTWQSKRSHLAKYVRTYKKIHDEENILTDAKKGKNELAIKKALEVLDVYDEELGSEASKIEYAKEIKYFFDRLHDWDIVKINPVEKAMKEFGWSRSNDSNKPSLDSNQIRSLYNEAKNIEEELIIIGLAAWGLRRNELSSLHINQLNLGDDPHIHFEDRKNGPGEVSIIYGLDKLNERTCHLSNNPDWNGYIFPSGSSKTGHITSRTIENKLKKIAESSDVRVNGELPTPHMARRYWYSKYLESMTKLRETLEDIAEDQGSSDINTIIKNYLSDTEPRVHRRSYMRKELKKIFEET